MYVLGIETSCDETSCAIVKDGKAVLSNIVASSLQFHKKYGGIVPEIASRMQLETITQVADCALKEAKIKLEDVDLVSVTDGPGLLGSLVVGISFAKAVSLSLNIPLLGLNHLYSHIYAAFLNNPPVRLPFIALIVSGGHTSLFLVKDFDRIKILGSTEDDACGEAFDKVAKILNLGYPGGPIIERLSRKGDPKKIKFNCSGTNQPLNFSFSGIKTAVLYYVKNKFDTRCSLPAGQAGMLDTRKRQYRGTDIADIAASFQEAAINALIKKSLLACKINRVNRLVAGGGVAANSRLREKLNQQAQGNSLKVYFPPKELCMDNAAMVAGLGYRLFKKGKASGLDLNVSLD